VRLDDNLQQFVKKAIVMSLDKGSYERELISQLLSAFYNSVIPAGKFFIESDVVNCVADIDVELCF
jgi:hypothetical protein